MMENLKNVTGQALEDHIAYLRQTPAALAAKWLDARVLRLQTGCLGGVSELGDLNSIFST
jgi:hypothetical protein